MQLFQMLYSIFISSVLMLKLVETNPTVPSSETYARKCIEGQVYQKPLEDKFNNEVAYKPNYNSFCCPKNQREFAYLEHPNAADYECCTGALNPIYNKHTQSCENARIVQKVTATSTETYARKCIEGQVYQKPLEDKFNDEVAYKPNYNSFCCPKNQREFAYLEHPNAADYECCTGAPDPIYNKHTQSCENARIVEKVTVTSTGLFKLDDPLRFHYYFVVENCTAKVGTLLLQANFDMNETSKSLVSNFLVRGPIPCRTRRKNEWFVLSSRTYLNSLSTSLEIESRRDIIRPGRKMKNYLKNYLKKLRIEAE